MGGGIVFEIDDPGLEKALEELRHVVGNVPNCGSVLRRAKRGAFLMKHERAEPSEPNKISGWVGLVVGSVPHSLTHSLTHLVVNFAATPDLPHVAAEACTLIPVLS